MQKISEVIDALTTSAIVIGLSGVGISMLLRVLGR